MYASVPYHVIPDLFFDHSMPVFLGLRKKPLVRVIKIQRERIINHEKSNTDPNCGGNNNDDLRAHSIFHNVCCKGVSEVVKYNCCDSKLTVDRLDNFFKYALSRSLMLSNGTLLDLFAGASIICNFGADRRVAMSGGTYESTLLDRRAPA